MGQLTSQPASGQRPAAASGGGMSVVYPQCVQTQTKSDQSDHTTSTADPEVPRVGTIIDRLRGLLYTEPDTLQIWGPPGGLWASWPRPSWPTPYSRGRRGQRQVTQATPTLR